MKENLLVSACLLGLNTKYNGKNNYALNIEQLKEKYNIIPVCPEVAGGLSTPRLPSEILNDEVINQKNQNVSPYFYKGAEVALALIKKYGITKALLKDGSPSCGSKRIYDGTFSNHKIDGQGITVRLLEKNHVTIFTEQEIDKL